MEYQQNAQYYEQKAKELNVIEINNRRLEYLDDLNPAIELFKQRGLLSRIRR